MKIQSRVQSEHPVVTSSAASSALVMKQTLPASFWSAVEADITRFREEDGSLRTLIRGLLSQGFQALFVYRVFRWFHERRIPTQPVRFLFERFIEMTTG